MKDEKFLNFCKNFYKSTPFPQTSTDEVVEKDYNEEMY